MSPYLKFVGLLIIGLQDRSFVPLFVCCRPLICTLNWSISHSELEYKSSPMDRKGLSFLFGRNSGTSDGK